ncbi:hypothetical protein Z043_109746 [Scleropages formosus]|uniref:Threonylcarbamoyl-AMP synthase n=1 Tax=Scleropages formosus TaxID=113540 RepID=A0A0P7YUB5_SCLFO|nr:hypothetical protein Z043_109746 [Scleropages formosus]
MAAMTFRGFASVFYSEPAVLGMLANVFSAFYVALQNFAHVSTGTPALGLENTLAGIHLILIGGLVQLVAGLLTFRKYDHLAGTTFVAFSALWGSYGATRLVLGSWEISKSSVVPTTVTALTDKARPDAVTPVMHTTAILNHFTTTLFSSIDATAKVTIALANATIAPTVSGNISVPQPPPIAESAVAGLVPYITIAFIVTFCSATANYVMPVVFGAITLTLVMEAIGVRVAGALGASGFMQLVITAVGLYGAAALLLKGLYQRHVLPGFGNAPFDVLLLGAAIKQSERKQVRKGGEEEEEKKKNSKYAEPFALGNMADTVAAAVLAFHSFGYPASFQVGVLWVTIDAAALLLASYYACLRGDSFHCTKFGLHCALWLVLALEEFVASVGFPRLALGLEEGALGRLSLVGGWFFLLSSLPPFLLSLCRDRAELLHNLSFTFITIAALPQMPSHSRGVFLGLTLSFYSGFSLYMSFVSLVNSIAEKSLISRGSRLLTPAKLQEMLFGLKRCLTPHPASVPPAPDSPAQLSARLPDALFYLCNGLAAWAAITGSSVGLAQGLLALPGVLVPGTVMQLYVARLQVRGGRRFGPTVPFCYAAIWATWGLLRLAAAYSNVILLILTITMEALLVCFLLFTLNRPTLKLEAGLLAYFGTTCLYGATAALTNHVFEKNLIPMGPKVIKVSSHDPCCASHFVIIHPVSVPEQSAKPKAVCGTSPPCPCPTSEKTSGLRTIAAVLGRGGVCGIPSDTVYTLAASCRHPSAIQRIYNIKERPLEKPICLTIASLKQLEAVEPPFSPLLWEFMRHVYPGGIGCIVHKGPWLRKLGVGEAYDYVGTKESIMIRISDLTVTSHLLSMTGPLAITSANPSGEPDSTHHDMVVSRLADKLDGVLCDGDSTELVSSTVVICTKIDEGRCLSASSSPRHPSSKAAAGSRSHCALQRRAIRLLSPTGKLSFLREGAVPKAKVLEIFEKVKNKMAATQDA